MNLYDRKYAEFKVSDLFTVKYGVNLELNACVECDKLDDDKVNFVARTAENNGVSAYVNKIKGIVPQRAGLISVAGGGSVLSTFLQNEPFYSGRDLYTLDSKDNISDEAKMFIITVIEQNKYKYSYGRQANKTLPDLLLKLPINNEGKPDYQFMEDYIKSLHHKPLTTKNKSGQAPDLNVQRWEEFRVGDLFNLQRGHTLTVEQKEDFAGDIPCINGTIENNGVQCKLSEDIESIGFNIIKAPAISIVRVGNGGKTFVQTHDFYIADNAFALNSLNDISFYSMLFVSVLLDIEQIKYSYGRTVTNAYIDTVIKLPVNADGNPDWQFMEDYIKALPYGDRLEG